MSLAITDAATAGLRVARRSPGAVAIWTVVYFLAMALAIGLVFLAMGPSLFTLIQQSSAAPNTATPDPATALRFLGGAAVGFAIAIPVFMIVSAMLLAAIYRAVLRPEDKGFGYLKLGGDEWRLLLVMILFGVLAMVVFTLVGGGLMVAVTTLWRTSKGSSVLLGILGGGAFFCLYAWLGIRLSLIYPITFAEKRIQLFTSWSLTKGLFWPLLGTYLLAMLISWAMSFAFSIVATIVQTSLMFAMLGGAGGQASLTSGTMTPVTFVPIAVGFLINMLGMGLQLSITSAPAAAVYGQLKGPDVSAVF